MDGRGGRRRRREISGVFYGMGRNKRERNRETVCVSPSNKYTDNIQWKTAADPCCEPVIEDRLVANNHLRIVLVMRQINKSKLPH